MTNPKITAVTTFPNKHYNLYAKQMVESFCQYWPEDVKFWIQLDDEPQSEAVINELKGMYKQKFTNRVNDGATCEWTPEYLAWKARNKDKNWGKDYRKQYYRFGHKVFAIAKAAQEALFNGSEYMIWIDADVITKKQVTWEVIKEWLPTKLGGVAYLGRKDWPHSETGFLIFDLYKTNFFFRDWLSLYHDEDLDRLLKEEQWHDAWAFDLARERACQLDNLSEGISGRDVFEQSPLGQYMEHYKGPRKQELIPKQPQAVNVDLMEIKTKNCLPDERIKENVSANLLLIDEKNWLKQCKPHGEEVVIVSAGPSLSPDEIMPLYKRGVKIVAVKHALNTLLEAGIVPWACMLLDPREHVTGFVENPHPDVNYLVSSMVDPKVTQALIKNRCKVYGYHAFVGAGEVTRIPKFHIVVQGGSATATRGISLMDMLGFRKMHLFAYDCCYLEEPDINKLDEKGRPKYMKLVMTVQSWAGKEARRTFWTEGQFLAQVNEMRKVYFNTPGIELNVYGEGIIPWMRKHELKYKAWGAWMNEALTERENKGVELDSLILPASKPIDIEGWLNAT